MKSAADRENFLNGMEVMMNVKRTIMKYRDLIAESKDKLKTVAVEADNEDYQDLVNFYSNQISNALNDVEVAKSKAKEMIAAIGTTDKKAQEIFQEEFDNLPI